MDIDEFKEKIYPGLTCRGQVISNFLFGIIFSPWSKGFVLLIIYMIVFEVFYFCLFDDYNIYERILIISMYFIGYLFGRFICNIKIFVDYE